MQKIFSLKKIAFVVILCFSLVNVPAHSGGLVQTGESIIEKAPPHMIGNILFGAAIAAGALFLLVGAASFGIGVTCMLLYPSDDVIAFCKKVPGGAYITFGPITPGNPALPGSGAIGFMVAGLIFVLGSIGGICCCTACCCCYNGNCQS